MAKLSEQPFGLGGRLGFILGASGVMGAINVHWLVASAFGTLYAGNFAGQNLFQTLFNPYSVFFIGIPVLFWMGVALPIFVHLHLYYKYKRPPHASLMTLPVLFLGLACAGILLGLVFAPRNSGYMMIPLVGMLSGFACAPFLLFLIRKPLAWTVICLSFGGIVSALCWSGVPLLSGFSSGRGIGSAIGYLFILAPALAVILPVPFIFRYAKDAPPLPQYASLSEYARDSARCPSCDYDLSGLPDGVLHCPECAHPRHTDSVESVRRLLATTQRSPAEIAAFLASGTDKAPDPAPEGTPD